MLARDIIKNIHSIAPPKLIEKSWDNSGLQIGSLDRDIKRILVALDVSPITVKYSLDNSIDMIISHHPFFFTPIKFILQDSIKGKMITDLIKNDIIVYSIHTNLDSAENGINEILGKRLELLSTEVLTRSYSEKLFKVAVFVPISHIESVRDAMANSGGGFIGNYSHCTFNTKGTGTFKPREGTNPYIGEINKLEFVDEVKIETIVEEPHLDNLIESMIKAHPYEEVAYDVYNLYNEGKEFGYGRVGKLKQVMTLYDMALFVKEVLECDIIKLYGDPKTKIKRVAICGGSGSDFIKDVYYKKADVYITGDIKYHDAQLALEKGVTLIDAGHFYTERIALPYIKEFLEETLSDDVQVISFNEKSIPFMTV